MSFRDRHNPEPDGLRIKTPIGTLEQELGLAYEELSAKHARLVEALEGIVREVEADERFHYPPASVFSNSVLALIQVDLTARHNTATKLLTLLRDEPETPKGEENVK